MWLLVFLYVSAVEITRVGIDSFGYGRVNDFSVVRSTPHVLSLQMVVFEMAGGNQ